MARMREHITGLDLFNVIASPCKDLQIPGKSCRITGNINNLFRPDFQNGLQTSAVTSLAGRIHYDQIYLSDFSLLFLVFHISRQDFLRFSRKKLRIFNAVSFGVPFCVLYGGGNDLYAVDFWRNAVRCCRVFQSAGD